MRILACLQCELAKGHTEFTKLETKRIYMQRVETYEKSEDEVIQNRLYFRNYIRELILNQQRVMEKIAKNAAGGEEMLE